MPFGVCFRISCRKPGNVSFLLSLSLGPACGCGARSRSAKMINPETPPTSPPHPGLLFSHYIWKGSASTGAPGAGTPGSTREGKTQPHLPCRQKSSDCKLVCQYACPMRGYFLCSWPYYTVEQGVCGEAGTKGNVEDARNVCPFL